MREPKVTSNLKKTCFTFKNEPMITLLVNYKMFLFSFIFRIGTFSFYLKHKICIIRKPGRHVVGTCKSDVKLKFACIHHVDDHNILVSKKVSI